jgi:hypothetical protein
MYNSVSAFLVICEKRSNLMLSSLQFTKLFGKATSNKNDVIVGSSWKFTGKRNER